MRNSNAKVCLPNASLNLKSYSSPDYKKWWYQAHGSYLEVHNKDLVNPKLINVLAKEALVAESRSPHDGHDKKTSQTSIVPSSIGVEALNVEVGKKMSNSRYSEDSRSTNDDRHWKRIKLVVKPHVPVKELDVCAPVDEVFHLLLSLILCLFPLSFC